MTAGTTISRRMEKVETGAGMGTPPESQYCFALSGSEVSMENRVDYTPFLLNLESDKLGCSECQLDQGFRGNWIDGLPMMLMYLCEIHLLRIDPFRSAGVILPKQVAPQDPLHPPGYLTIARPQDFFWIIRIGACEKAQPGTFVAAIFLVADVPSFLSPLSVGHDLESCLKQ